MIEITDEAFTQANLKAYDFDKTAIDLALEFGIILTQHNNDLRIYQKIKGVGNHTD